MKTNSCEWNKLRARRFFAALGRLLLVAQLALIAPGIFAASPDDVYLLGPDSLPHENVPHGRVIGPLTLSSQVFTNTTRHYWIYVPAQYEAAKPACLMIFQDGHAFVN